MKKGLLLLALAVASGTLGAQGVSRFDFNLYTDSLKKGFYNYINVDAQLTDGSWRPLDSTQLRFTANTGFFKGNDLFIDSSYHGDSVRVRAELRSDPKQSKEVIIYIRRRPFEALPSEREVIDRVPGKQREA
ncbi:hypothetical protein [Flaviaesturariibacter amylovorans]|uniref:Uncharacterized protein n=1 Tax=Flaviaesturariibacter amylovorans TaxID=1084520 RepID=A0ABP8GQY7_9BACT